MLQDGVSPEIMALAEGYTDIADLLNRVRGVRYSMFIPIIWLNFLKNMVEFSQDKVELSQGIWLYYLNIWLSYLKNTVELSQENG
jgi:hypothetical protein